MNSKEIPIFFSCDDYYAPFLSVALHSAAKNASPSRKYTAIVLYKDMTEENRERLSRLATENFHITFVPMQEELQEMLFGELTVSMRSLEYANFEEKEDLVAYYEASKTLYERLVAGE